MPDAKTWMNVPDAHTSTARRQAFSRPRRSLRSSAKSAPNAAPSTLNEVILALRLARPVGSFSQCDEMRL